MKIYLSCWYYIISGGFCWQLHLSTINEIQSQYYHLEKISLMVHIMYKHGLGNGKDERVILKECHFYISDNKCYNFAYVQHCFPLFYGDLEENNICT
jgi:hypothetical protein